jgi:hypothetical protein
MPASNAAFVQSEETTSTRTDELPLQHSNFRRHYVVPPERRWHVEVVQKLLGLTRLGPNWDGYGAPPTKWDAGMFALNVLDQVMSERTPIPQVVPSSTGGVQLEWHERQMDIELHVDAPYACELWVRDLRSGRQDISIEISDDFSELQRAISTLTRR